MKRFAWATLAALAAVVASEQQAKAWFNFSIGGSAYMNISWGGWPCCGCGCACAPCTFGSPYFDIYGPAGYMPGPIVSSPYYGAPSGPGYTAPMPGSGSGSGSTSASPMSYGYAPAYGYGHGYGMPAANVQPVSFQAPSYWYGR